MIQLMADQGAELWSTVVDASQSGGDDDWF
jgi:hypothetical protein